MTAHTTQRRVLLFPVALALLLCASLAQPASATDRLTKIQFWSMGTSTRISLQFIFFDLPGVTFSLEGKSRGIYQLPVSDKLVNQIRVANQSATQTRVVVDLEADAEYTVAELKAPNRLIIEVSPAGGKITAPAETPSVSATVGAPPVNPPAPVPSPVTAPAAVAAPPVVKETPKPVVRATRNFIPPPPTPKRRNRQAEPLRPFESPSYIARSTWQLPRTSVAPMTAANRLAPAPPRPGATPPVETAASNIRPVNPIAEPPARVATPANANSAGDRSLTRALGLKFNRIVIDAGHGGQDHGTTGPGGLKEKDLVLDLAMRVGRLVEERIGAEVIYTRETDVFIPLEERPQIANDRHADLFLSIHANSSTIKTVTGVETYYLSVASSRQAMEVAARENAASAMSISDLEQLVQKITLNEKVRESVEFAGRVQTALANGTGTTGKARNRGVRKAPFIVLIGAKMPAILAEVGFLSNPQEEEAMMTDEYRDKLAEALVKGIESYGQTLSRFQLANQPGNPRIKPASTSIETSSGGGAETKGGTVAARARRSGASN
jgi:N-acetylmuramoyl-L-alanine amidase